MNKYLTLDVVWKGFEIITIGNTVNNSVKLKASLAFISRKTRWIFHEKINFLP